jgi:hypothetical protein
VVTPVPTVTVHGLFSNMEPVAMTSVIMAVEEPVPLAVAAKVAVPQSWYPSPTRLARVRSGRTKSTLSPTSIGADTMKVRSTALAAPETPGLNVAAE